MGQKFCRNHSITHHFRGKCVFAFYTEIQDGRQKWWENDFWETVADDSVYTLGGQKFCRNRSISHCFQDKHVFVYYVEIQNGRFFFGKYGRYFWQIVADDSAYTLLVKKCHQNGCISHRCRDKYVFAFYTEIQYGLQKWWENHF